MPRFKHVIESEYKPSFRTQKVVGMFDVPVTEKLRKSWDVDFPIEKHDWQVGLIVGSSGSGKTTLAKKIFNEENYFTGHDWGDSSILDDFSEDINIKDITGALSHVGFASPPAWLLPYSVLSNGQKFRVDLARAILENESPLVFDEFSSVVDRTVAQVGSYAVQRFVRKQKKQFVAISCHYDINEWLEPDWVYDVDANEFIWGRLRRPSIEAKVIRCHHSAWRLFKGHHYLSADINISARCYIMTIDEVPVAFCAILPFPHPKLRNCYKGHRTVVLPDYQGVGLGNKLSETVGDIILSEGKRFISSTSHPAMIGHRTQSNKWILTKTPGRSSKPVEKSLHRKTSSWRRLYASFEYLGDRNINSA